MAIPEFPAYALMLADGFAEEADYGVMRTEMDSGVPKQARRFSVPIIARTINIRVRSDADRLRFDDWVRVDLAGGVGWFNWLDPIGGQRKRARLIGKPACRWQRDGLQRWQASLQLETCG
ncbi:hypothetical protein AA0N74_01610 [Chromobacterium vaccinii]|uniref:hypothetical protein n=1 Tax=Chromobacterium vaccinii TaxID=1108595 RepID=UPI0031D11F4B